MDDSLKEDGGKVEEGVTQKVPRRRGRPRAFSKTLTPVKDWQKKYIELRSDITNEMTDREIAEACGISHVWLSTIKRKYPELQKAINDNLAKSHDALYDKSRRLAFRRMEKSDKILQIVLEMTGQYNSPEQIDRYKAMAREQLLHQVKMKLEGLTAIQDTPEEDILGLPNPNGHDNKENIN